MKRREPASDSELLLPPREKPVREPADGPRWLHGMTGLVLGSLMGLGLSTRLWRLMGIPPWATVLAASVGVGIAGAVWRGRLWRGPDR